jgi:hypothetical protein
MYRLLLIALLLPALASADGFEIIQDGKKYWCESAHTDPGQAAACATTAFQGPFSQAQAIRLCQGATSVAPAHCGIKAFQGPFNQDQAVELCNRAISNAPADCAIKAFQGPFNHAQSVRLCRRARSTAPADCAIQAFQGPYNADQAVELCSGGAPDLVLKLLREAQLKTERIQPNSFYEN